MAQQNVPDVPAPLSKSLNTYADVCFVQLYVNICRPNNPHNISLIYEPISSCKQKGTLIVSFPYNDFDLTRIFKLTKYLKSFSYTSVIKLPH